MEIRHVDFSIVVHMLGNPQPHVRCWTYKDHWGIDWMGLQQPEGHRNVVITS